VLEKLSLASRHLENLIKRHDEALAETWSVLIDLLFLMFLDVMEVKWIY
jgi:hypothetical protein